MPEQGGEPASSMPDCSCWRAVERSPTLRWVALVLAMVQAMSTGEAPRLEPPALLIGMHCWCFSSGAGPVLASRGLAPTCR